jgi:uncharacterized protein
MRRLVIIDTGPLVAYFVHNEQHHEWSLQQWAETERPFLTCEAVIAEACHLLRAIPGGSRALLDYIRRGGLKVAFHLEEHAEPVALLMRKYANVPISLADGCLVRMAEAIPGSTVLTLDRDFRIYRKSNRTIVPTIVPDR